MEVLFEPCIDQAPVKTDYWQQQIRKFSTLRRLEEHVRKYKYIKLQSEASCKKQWSYNEICDTNAQKYNMPQEW